MSSLVCSSGSGAEGSVAGGETQLPNSGLMADLSSFAEGYLKNYDVSVSLIRFIQGACRGVRDEVNGSVPSPGSTCVCCRQPDFHTGRIPHFTLVLFLLFINADEIPHSLMPVLSFSTSLLKDPSAGTWVKVFISLDCKCSFELQAVPCSRTWRRNMSNTLHLGESFPSLAMMCCGERALTSFSRSPRNVDYWCPGSLGNGAGLDSQADYS